MIEHHKKQLILKVAKNFVFPKQIFYDYIGAKVLYYDDPKYGPSLELTWANRRNDAKHYNVNYMNFFMI